MVLKSVGATGQLEWAEDEGIIASINGITTNNFPVTEGPNTVGDSIMSQDVDTPSPTHHRIKIESPVFKSIETKSLVDKDSFVFSVRVP